MSAPKRLLEDPETASALRADLQVAASHQVNFDMAAGLARFEATLATGSAASVTGLKAMLVKLGVAGVVVGGAVLGVALIAGNSGEPTASVVTPPVSVTPPVARAVPVPSTASESSAPPAVVEPIPTAPTPTLRRTAKAAPKPAAASAASPEARDDLLQREVQQLRQIRQLVAANPGQALALANEGHGTFRGGVLYQEREALALQALSALGRRTELETRGERYLRAFPKGSFSTRVRQLLGR
jgi:hypothetical protein